MDKRVRHAASELGHGSLEPAKLVALCRAVRRGSARGNGKRPLAECLQLPAKPLHSLPALSPPPSPEPEARPRTEDERRRTQRIEPKEPRLRGIGQLRALAPEEPERGVEARRHRRRPLRGGIGEGFGEARVAGSLDEVRDRLVRLRPRAVHDGHGRTRFRFGQELVSLRRLPHAEVAEPEQRDERRHSCEEREHERSSVGQGPPQPAQLCPQAPRITRHHRFPSSSRSPAAARLPVGARLSRSDSPPGARGQPWLTWAQAQRKSSAAVGYGCTAAATSRAVSPHWMASAASPARSLARSQRK